MRSALFTAMVPIGENRMHHHSKVFQDGLFLDWSVNSIEQKFVSHIGYFISRCLANGRILVIVEAVTFFVKIYGKQ